MVGRDTPRFSLAKKTKMRKKWIFSFFFLLLSSSSTFLCQDQDNKRIMVFASHISLTVDDETFAELQTSDFLLNEFARTTVKLLKVDSELSWTGVYIFGRNTYLEFFVAEKDWPVGSCSIAFKVSEVGALKKLKDKLEEQWGISFGEIELRTKITDELESPWFHYLDLYDFIGSNTLSPWLLEWHPESIAQYFNKPITKLVDEHGARYDDPSFSAERILENIIEINVPLKRSELEEWSQFLMAIGFERKDFGNEVHFFRSDLMFNFFIDSKASILELKMSLLREYKSREEYCFGKRLRLKFNGDRTASLFFKQNQSNVR